MITAQPAAGETYLESMSAATANAAPMAMAQRNRTLGVTAAAARLSARLRRRLEPPLADELRREHDRLAHRAADARQVGDREAVGRAAAGEVGDAEGLRQRLARVDGGGEPDQLRQPGERD